MMRKMLLKIPQDRHPELHLDSVKSVVKLMVKPFSNRTKLKMQLNLKDRGPRLGLRKGEVFAYVGLPQNLKDLKVRAETPF